jgi:hypothetical protein
VSIESGTLCVVVPDLMVNDDVFVRIGICHNNFSKNCVKYAQSECSSLKDCRTHITPNADETRSAKIHLTTPAAIFHHTRANEQRDTTRRRALQFAYGRRLQ